MPWSVWWKKERNGKGKIKNKKGKAGKKSPTRLGFGRNSLHLDIPAAAVRNAVGHGAVHASRESLRGALRVGDEKGDGRVGHLDDVPETPGPIVPAAVEGVAGAVVLLRVVGLAIDGVLGATDPVDVAARDGVVDGMTGVDSYGSDSQCQVN